MKQYRNLLPAYLQGQNIERHAEILETQDNLLYDNMLLLMTMFDLNRPILIEKVQEEPATCTMNVYVNTQYPIRKVKVTGDASLLIEYDEEDRKLQEKYTFTCTDTYPAVSPALTVVVETYNDEEYVKAYPENDEIQFNKNDHDIFLDRIGALLGIPRRVYTEQNIGQTVSEYLKLYPHFFTKQGYGKQVGEAYTEDDYYYHKRLIKFITERGQKPLPVLMSELLYEWNNVNYSNLLLRETSISDDLTEYVGQPILQIINNEEKYTNMDYTDMQNIISEYNMITRPILLTDKREAWNIVYLKEGGVSSDVHETFTYPNLTRLEVESWWQSLDGAEDGDLYNAPFTLELYNHKKDYVRTIGRYTTGDNAKTTINLQGIPTGDMTFIARPVEEYEYKFAEESRLDTTIDSSFYADLNLWTGGQYQGTSISQLQQPFFNQDDLLSVGRRYLCALPVIDPKLVDLSSYYVSLNFRYTHNYQKIGLINMRQNNDGTYTQTTNWLTPYDVLGAGNYNNDIMLECDFIDNTMYYYLNGDYTGISQDWTGREGMIYLAGYNINATTPINHVGLYIDTQSTYVQDENAYGSSPE